MGHEIWSSYTEYNWGFITWIVTFQSIKAIGSVQK